MKLLKLLFLLVLAVPCMAQDLRPSAYIGRNGIITVRGGKVLGSSGGVTNISGVDIQLSPSSTTYIYLDLSGTPVVASNTTGFPAGSFFPICIAVTDINNVITSFTDSRPDYFMAGGNGAQSPVASPNPFNFDVNMAFKGPNPYVDATRYGVRALASLTGTPAVNGITATTTGGSPTVTVSTATCNAQTGSVCFVNGDGVVLVNAGNSHSMTTPGAPTVTPFNSRFGTGTGDGVAAPAGATTYNYKVFVFDLMHGTTVASAAGSTTTGPATLGEGTYTITGATKSNDTITFTGATQPAVSAGAFAIVDSPTQSGDNCYLGYWKIATVTGTGFTSTGVGIDTRNGLPANCLATSNGGFTAHFFTYNKVTWSAVTGAQGYGICSDRASPGTYHLLGMSLLPVNPANATFTYGTLEFDDFGATMLPNVVGPWEFSDANCTAGSPTNDDWVTTIASGAGTTTLTMAGNAPNSNGGGQPIRFDNSANYLTAANANQNKPILLPFDAAGGQYVFNSPLNISSINNVMLAPQGFTTNASIFFNVNSKLICDWQPSTGNAVQFASISGPTIFTYGYAGIFVTSGLSFYSSGCTFSGPDNANAVLLQDSGGGNLGSTYVNEQFLSGSTNNDYLGKSVVLRGASGASGVASFNGKINLKGGSQTMGGHQATPGLFCYDCGKLHIAELMGSGRGIGVMSDPSGMTVNIEHGDWQGGSTPLLLEGGSAASGNAVASISLGTRAPILLDTMSQPCLSYIPSVGTNSIFLNSSGSCSPVGTGPLRLTGARIQGNGLSIVPDSQQGQNRDYQGLASGTACDGVFVSGGANCASYPQVQTGASVSVEPSYPVFIKNATQMALPTCSVSVGGSVSIGSHTYKVAPVWWNKGVDLPSLASTVCTTTSGNQTVQINWAAIPGNPAGYDVYEDGLQRGNSGGWPNCGTSPMFGPSTLTITVTADINCGIGVAAIPSGGPSMLMPGTQGIVAPVVQAPNVVSNGGACTNAELALSAGWQSTGSATVTAAAGLNQTCSWTITTGTTTAANPTITDTLINPLPNANIVCEMNIHGGTHTAAAGEGFQQTTLSATAPVFTFNGTPTAGGTTYFITRRCGP